METGKRRGRGLLQQPPPRPRPCARAARPRASVPPLAPQISPKGRGEGWRYVPLSSPPSVAGLPVLAHANSPGALAGRGRSSIRCVRRSPAPSPSRVPPPRSPQRPPPPPCSPARREQVRAPRPQRLRAGPGRGRELGEAPAVAAGPAPPGLRRSGDSGGRAPAAGEVGGRRGGRALAFVRGRGAQSRPRGEAGKEARHRYARGADCGGGGRRRPEAGRAAAES